MCPLLGTNDFLDNIGQNLWNRFRGYIYSNYVEEAKQQKKVIFLKLYMKLQAGGWPLVLFSRKPEKLRSTAFEYLISAGCGNWSSLVMRYCFSFPLLIVYYTFNSLMDYNLYADYYIMSRPALCLSSPVNVPLICRKISC